jgi:hypothetical protein
MLKTIWLSIAFLFFFTGCAVTSTKMVNDKGQVANCGSWGFGVIGAPAALISTENCIEQYKAAGYHEIGEPQPQTSIQQPQAGNADVLAVQQNNPVTLISNDGKVKITLPSGWLQAAAPIPAHQLHAKNAVIDAGLLINYIDNADVKDLETFAKSQNTKLINNLSDGSASEVKKIKVNGNDAFQTEIVGTAKNSLRIKYLITNIDSGKLVVTLMTWTLESKYDVNRAYFEGLPKKLEI